MIHQATKEMIEKLLKGLYSSKDSITVSSEKQNVTDAFIATVFINGEPFNVLVIDTKKTVSVILDANITCHNIYRGIDNG